MIHPQEIEVWYVLPAIRKEMAIALKKEGMAQKKIAEIFGVTPAAISQYISNKRGSDASMEKDIKKEVEKSIKIIIKDNKQMFFEMQKILKTLRDKGSMCSICKQKIDVPKDCHLHLK